jgi:hypothetical protein
MRDEESASSRVRAARRVVMAAFVVAVDACCPLCGVSILSIGRGGRVESSDLHPVALYRSRVAGRGYMVCDDCGTLAELSASITRN